MTERRLAIIVSQMAAMSASMELAAEGIRSGAAHITPLSLEQAASMIDDWRDEFAEIIPERPVIVLDEKKSDPAK